MPTDLPIQCKCGALKGVAHDMSRHAGTRVMCYCDDCQAYARYLGNPEGMLDQWGGTDVFGTTPTKVEFTAGTDQLACVRLTPKGPYRWYTECCKTPVANTGPGGVPHVGLIHSCLRPEGQSLDDVLGPVDARIMVRFAKDAPGDWPNAHDRFGARMVVGFLGRLALRRLGGHHKHSPFFDPESGQAIVKPHKLYEAD